MDATVGSRLASARKALNFTQDAFCSKTGIPKSSLQKYEGGHSVPGTEALTMIARAGIDVHWLVTGEHFIIEASPASQSTKTPLINEDALIAAFVGMMQAAPSGEAVADTAKKAIQFYYYLLQQELITPTGIGGGKLGQAA
jgi:transcriptional regulator with XRE-family HTH domain